MLDAVERVSRRRERRFALLMVSALTFLALAVHGYHPYAEDGGLYLAGVERLLDPGLFPHATEFVLAPMRFSAFAPVLAGMVRMSHARLPWALLALHVASLWAMLGAGWMLAGRCWQTRRARTGAVMALACWLGLPVAGTALLVMDPYLTARSFSTPCLLLALEGALEMTAWDGTRRQRRRGFGLWLASLMLGVAMHPLMGAYAMAVSTILVCMRARRSVFQVWGPVALCVAALGVAAMMQATAPGESADYVRIAMTRSYWFLAEWRWYEVAGLVAPLAILAIFARRRADEGLSLETRGRSDEARDLALAAVAAGVTAVLVALLFARPEAATHLVARMQPLRMFQAVYIVMALVLGAQLGEIFLRRSLGRWSVALAVLGGTMLIAARRSYPESSHLEMPWGTTANPWVRAFVWVRENTSKDALFALDADYIHERGEGAQCFRAIAERSVLPDYSKDGGEASIVPELTTAWMVGQAAQHGLEVETDAERIRALAPLGVSWMVLETGAQTHFACAYRNEAVKVCRIR